MKAGRKACARLSMSGWLWASVTLAKSGFFEGFAAAGGLARALLKAASISVELLKWGKSTIAPHSEDVDRTPPSWHPFVTGKKSEAERNRNPAGVNWVD